MAPLHSLISRFMRSLVMKFTVMTALLMIVTAALLMVIENSSDRRENEAVLIERAGMKAQILALNISDDIMAEDTTRLQSRIASLIERADVEQAFITDARRRILVHSDPANLIDSGRAADPLVVMALGSGETRHEIRSETLHVAAPVYSSANRLMGVVYTQSSMLGLRAEANIAMRRHMLTALFALLVLLPVAAGLVYASLRPISKLTEAARTASSKSLDVRINVKTGDELEVLANAFNRMLSRIDSNLKRIHRLAYVDLVTELPNRERFRKEVERVTGKAAETESSGAVLFLDLDRFKRVNDSLGMGEGDRLLELVARRLRETARGFDLAHGGRGEPSLVARLGGDEFTILVPQVDSVSDIARYAQQIISAISRPFDISGHQVFLGISVGAAVFPQDGAEPESLLRHADLAMAHAKQSGGNTVKFFEPSMNQSAFERLVLENELRDAVKNDQLVVYYQPKVRMSDGLVEGSEALVRWNHPTSGLLTPGHFIEAAEESGLIGEIGDWVMRKACQQAAEWASEGLRLPVAVNVSAIQFERPGFADSVMEILEQTGLPPELLEIELTESIAMRDPQRVIDQVQPLRDRGVKFAIDDFGTGHSSLSYLTKMPFDVFKIDQSFVRSMAQDPHARAVVETILALAKALKLKTVAEGVETTEQLTALREEGATLAQGYLFSKPVPCEDFEAYARASLADEIRAASA
ncbi:putative bifunctional diguanylate cyclase/phosphodiesterase [Hyphobacterium sp.]|uniref:putative bifunctional diguanylate cyclase/phosphodiesterase n=1 Tax=Hyphobacterium sp. TaxID=2004662 RepID=UPI003BA84560